MVRMYIWHTRTSSTLFVFLMDIQLRNSYMHPNVSEDWLWTGFKGQIFYRSLRRALCLLETNIVLDVEEP